MRIPIPLDLSTCSFIPLPRFIRSRPSLPLLTISLVLFPERSDESAHDLLLSFRFYFFSVLTWHLLPHFYHTKTKTKDQFRFLRSACLVNLEVSVGLILTNPLGMKGFLSILPSFLSISSYPPSSYSFPSLISSTFCLSGTWYSFINFIGFTVHYSFFH